MLQTDTRTAYDADLVQHPFKLQHVAQAVGPRGESKIVEAAMARPTVLVVDDDFLIRLHTADILEAAGFEVVEANDAANALALLQDMPGFQLICTDVQMPGELDGIDLALRVLERHPEMRVIIMSAHSGHRDRLPNVPFLSKPFLPSCLVDLARRELAA
jgi:DNA-binding NtrC family response regulator